MQLKQKKEATRAAPSAFSAQVASFILPWIKTTFLAIAVAFSFQALLLELR